MAKALRAVGAGLVGILIPSTGWAAGFEFPDNVTRAMGRGSAYVASVDEPSALYFNPAGLTRVKGFAATLNLNLVDYSAKFKRSDFVYGEADTPLTVTFKEVENSAGIYPAPMLFLADRFGLKDFAFGFGVYGPSAYGRREYPNMKETDPVPNRVDAVVERDAGNAYMLVSDDVLLVYPSIAAAYEIPDTGLSFGLTLQAALMRTVFKLGADGDGSFPGEAEWSSTEAPTFFIPNTIDTFGWSPSYILGAMYDAGDAWSFGASWRPAFDVQTEGSLDVELPRDLVENANLVIRNPKSRLFVSLPDVVRLGAVYRHMDAGGRELFDVEFNTVFERWSVLQYYDVDLQGVVTFDGDINLLGNDRPLPSLKLPRKYNDAFSFRLGSDISALRDATTGNGLVLRLGAFYEQAASPEDYTNLDFTSFDRYSGSLGASWHQGAWSFDVGASYIYSPVRNVTNGKYQILTPIWVCLSPPETDTEACAEQGDREPGHAVNSGRYDVSHLIWSLGATYGW